jgi:hypothetical protein
MRTPAFTVTITLIMLHSALMPAVLLEAGSIVNRQEGLELQGRRRSRVIGASAKI